MRRLEPSLDSASPPRPETEVATLRWLDGRAAGRVHVLDRSTTVIGRDESCRIRVEDEGVAERHAMIRATGGRPVLVDSDGRGATRLNGRVVDEAPLRDGDVVILGRHAVARFEYRGVRRAHPPNPDRPALSPGERAIASRFVRGHRDEQIGHSLGVPPRLVSERIAGLHRRFGTTERVDLIAALVDREHRRPGTAGAM